MPHSSRRRFLQSAAAAAAAPMIQTALAQDSPNERINVAVVGFHSRGMDHIRGYAKIPNVRITALCDVDERLFGPAVAEVERLSGHRPVTEVDMRRLLQRDDIDAFSIATPDYWHALQTIWACQAGKDVYVEKPVSFTIVEGRRMVEAARKYNRIVQAGTQLRSEPDIRAAVRLLNGGKMGKVYRASTDFSKPRASIGHTKEASIPEGVHWDLFLGPTPYRPYSVNRFHYGWHHFWDTAPSEVGNIGVHNLDICRWGMGKQVHPRKIHCTGGLFLWDSDQETPNLQLGTIEYQDGTILDFEVNTLCAPTPNRGTVFYTSDGYVTDRDGWKAVRGTITPRERAHPAGIDEHVLNAGAPRATYEPGPAIDPASEPQISHFENFIQCMRSRKVADLHCDILEGHLSTSLAQLATISYRLGRKLEFNPDTETFLDDAEADQYLKRTYRGFTLPDNV
jgi:predicted dehydrogenase